MSKTEMNTTRRYHDLSGSEKLALTTEQFTDSVKLEGLHRGIKPPITLSDALKNIKYVGFQIPADALKLYELVAPNDYSTAETGICYRTSEQAASALIGAVRVCTDYNKKSKIVDGDFSVRERWVSLSQAQNVAAKLEEFQQDNEAFDKLVDECAADLSNLKQESYNKRVRSERRVEYLRLSGGDLAIASAFWKKTEGTEFPDENGN